MSLKYLYSVVLELSAIDTVTIPATVGHKTHALFLDLIKQTDPILATRLHDEPGYRPFTVSSLTGTKVRGNTLFLQAGQLCRLRITLLDGGQLWQCLSARFLESSPISLHLDHANFTLHRLLSTPSADPTGWASFTDWQTLATTSAHRPITIHFASPTAFSMGDRQFALFPEPNLLWDSLMRTWNCYAPEVLKLDKLALRDFIKQNVVVNDYDLHTTALHYPTHTQKGFVGTCSYLIKEVDDIYTAQLTALASFALYAGIGSKTTMGMGQARAESIKAEEG